MIRYVRFLVREGVYILSTAFLYVLFVVARTTILCLYTSWMQVNKENYELI
jgi:hypothetical protein